MNSPLAERFQHISAHELATTARLLTDIPAADGFGLSDNTALRILEAAARSSCQTGFSFSDVAISLARDTARAKQDQQDAEEPAESFFTELTIGVACQSGNLAQRILGELAGVRDAHVITGSLDELCRCQPGVDVMIVAAAGSVPSALIQLKRVQRWTGVPVILIGPDDLGLALECLLAGAAEYVDIQNLASRLVPAICRALEPEPQSEEACDGRYGPFPETRQALPQFWHSIVDQVTDCIRSAWQLCHVSFDTCWIAFRDGTLATLAGAARGCLFAWVAFFAAEAIFSGSIEAIQHALPAGSPAELPTLGMLLWPALGAGGLAGAIDWLVAPVMSPQPR